MSRPTCKGCRAIIRWITTPRGKGMPVDPEKLQEWVTDKPVTPGARKIVLVTPEGRMAEGYQATVITPGSEAIEGYVPHWATCPQREQFKRRGGDGNLSDVRPARPVE